MKVGKIFLGVAASLLPLAASCRSPRIVVNVPAGYRGSVMVQCEATGSSATAIVVDAQGFARAKTCPTHPTELVITRDGHEIQPAQVPAWETTGDNIPVDIRFSVQ